MRPMRPTARPCICPTFGFQQTRVPNPACPAHQPRKH